MTKISMVANNNKKQNTSHAVNSYQVMGREKRIYWDTLKKLISRELIFAFFFLQLREN